MTQSRFASGLESLASTAIGYGTAVVANVLLLPAFSYPVSFADANGLALAFTAISILRGYLVRRLFVWLYYRGLK